MRVGCDVTAARRRASWLAQGAVSLDPGLRAMRARRSRESSLAAELPPWHDGCHGSRKGQCPLTPDCALCAQSVRGKAAWLRSYRRGTTGATARGSDTISSWLAGIDRHSTEGLVARCKCQRGFETTLAFFVAEIFKLDCAIQLAIFRASPTPSPRERICSCSPVLQNHPSYAGASQPRFSEPAPRQPRGQGRR